MSQERFTTSREVYHRIRWDPRLDAREFVIGYDAHSEEMEEMPFEAFVPDGEIPWHRVWYFRRGPEVVWDRRKRIDTLATLAPAAAEEPAPPPPPPSHHHAHHETPRFTPIPSYRYDARTGAWVEALRGASDSEPLPSLAELTVASFNVLFDLYDPELLDTRRRTAAALSLLRSVDADVLALQEVTGPFLSALLEAPWVREHFFLSEGPAATTVTPYGQVLLSRFPFTTLNQCVFSRDKRVIAGELSLRGGPLWVATLHLTSSRDAAGIGMRAKQVRVINDWARTFDEAPETPDLLLMGDFNLGDEDAPEAHAFADAGFTDAWSTLRPGEAGYTYDPARNAMAALTTTTQRSQRLDRMLVRSPLGRLKPQKVSLFGETPISGKPSPGGDPLFISDHFGLSCTLLRGAPTRAAPAPEPAGPPRVLSVPPVHQAAVVLIPPEELWSPIEAIRSRHDRTYLRWMPHVTLLYPFVPDEYFAEAEALIAEALRDVKPFQVTLTSFDSFEQRSSVTAWLRPEAHPHGALEALQSALEAALPQCDEQGRKSERGFTPHLSVGQLPRSSPAEVRRTFAAWERDWKPLTFEVREVCLISRHGDHPFEVRRRVALGGGKGPRPSSPPSEGSPAPTRESGEALRSMLKARGEWESAESRQQRTQAVSRLEAVCAKLGLELHPYGSYLLGTGSASSDVDAIAIGPSHLSREGFAKALLAELSGQKGFGGGRFVEDAAIPMVKLTLDGVHFDVSYASRPEGVEPCPPAELLTQHGEQLDTAGFRSLNGWADTNALLEVVGREGAGLERFRTVLRAVRAWAKTHGVYSHALGYLGGLSWAVLVAWDCVRAPREASSSEERQLAHFFETFAAWPWPQPVTLTPETARYSPNGKRDLMPIIAPAQPLRNTARNVSRSTLQVLREEFARAQDLLHRAREEGTPEAWQALFTPVDLAKDLSTRLEVTVEAETSEAREMAAGWVLGHLTALVYRLEGDRRLFARPFPNTNPEGPFTIGLAARGANGAEALSVRAGSPLSRTLDEFRESFQAWSHRPPSATLSVRLTPYEQLSGSS
ncbi:poly(A) polymerase [Hyalangium rubrum]|uniref:Poly(A) polymerase n=1 Tax=Hyalangium rubrum TaxID=3103134 RepID=A0ABU5HD67_9BACT|nr:poly(A) polymerase [Hyalangium sp. s54d21]MDY7231411.1 poly(A) polymerase [Hyalangium sp. s54d21]